MSYGPFDNVSRQTWIVGAVVVLVIIAAIWLILA
jgi:hypothetical protein